MALTGNIVLKYTARHGKNDADVLKGLFKANTMTKMSALLMKNQLPRSSIPMMPVNTAAHPSSAFPAPVIKAHGSSNAKAFKNAIRQAIEYANTGVTYEIARAIEDARARKAVAAPVEPAAGNEGSGEQND